MLSLHATKLYRAMITTTSNEEVKARFDEENIEIPFPHVSIYSGEASKSIPIELIGGKLDEANKSAFPFYTLLPQKEEAAFDF